MKLFTKFGALCALSMAVVAAPMTSEAMLREQWGKFSTFAKEVALFKYPKATITTVAGAAAVIYGMFKARELTICALGLAALCGVGYGVFRLVRRNKKNVNVPTPTPANESTSGSVPPTSTATPAPVVPVTPSPSITLRSITSTGTLSPTATCTTVQTTAAVTGGTSTATATVNTATPAPAPVVPTPAVTA